jgi:hypothetical protein
MPRRRAGAITTTGPARGKPRAGSRRAARVGTPRHRAALFAEGALMAGADPMAVSRILAESGIACTVIGGIAVGCYSGRPRATRDVDLVIDRSALPRSVAADLRAAVGARRIERLRSSIAFIGKTAAGERELLDVITTRAGSYGLALEHCETLDIAGTPVRIPTVEAMLALKYTAAVNPVRSAARAAQDWADIWAIADAQPSLRFAVIELLAEQIVPGFGIDLVRRLRAHRRGG